jgi:hypothetical protein
MRSSNLDFFAAENDQKALFDFLFSSTDVRVFESYSEPDSDLREFSSTDELAAAFSIGQDPNGRCAEILLQLWSPSVMSELIVRRFALDPADCSGQTFRHSIEGAGLIQLYLGGVIGHTITKSHFGHQSQKRAKAWGLDRGTNWEALSKVSSRIQYHIRKIAAAKIPGRPILPQAYELACAGYALKEAVQTPWQYELPPASDSR